MHKIISDLAWLLIRITGLLLCAGAIVSVIAHLYLSINIAQFTLERDEPLTFDAVAPYLPHILGPFALSVVASLVVGTYLLFKGAFIHHLLIRIPAKGPDTQPVPGSSVNPEPSAGETTKLMQNLYRQFIRSEGKHLPPSAKERHLAFRQWLDENHSQLPSS